MTLDWEPLGAAIAAAREALGMTRPQLAEATGLARSTIDNLENGRAYKRIPKTIIPVGKVFGWNDPMLVAKSILDGEPPPAVDPPSRSPEAAKAVHAAATDPRSGLTGAPMRIGRILREGQLVDTRIIEVDGLDLVVLLMGKPGEEVSDAQMSDGMANGIAMWSDLERRNQGLERSTDSDQEDS